MKSVLFISMLLLNVSVLANDDDFVIIDQILGRGGNALETQWDGTYFGAIISSDRSQFDYTFTNVVNSGTAAIAGNRYNNVVSGSLNYERLLAGIVLGRNFVYGDFLLGVEGIITTGNSLSGDNSANSAQELYTTTQQAQSTSASSKGTRTAQNFSDGNQTLLAPSITVEYAGGIDVRLRFGYIDDQINIYTTLGYVTATWNIDATANTTTSLVIGPTQTTNTIQGEEIVRGWSIGIGFEYSFEGNVFTRWELTSNSYQEFRGARNSNQVSFDLAQNLNTTSFNTTVVYRFR